MTQNRCHHPSITQLSHGHNIIIFLPLQLLCTSSIVIKCAMCITLNQDDMTFTRHTCNLFDIGVLLKKNVSCLEMLS